MKIPTRDNIDRWLFDYTEGNLSSDQEELLENYLLNNPDLEVDLDAWNESHIVAEPLVFKEKERLFKKRRVVPFYWSVAAMLLLIVSLFVYNHQTSSGQNTLAKIENTSNSHTSSSALPNGNKTLKNTPFSANVKQASGNSNKSSITASESNQKIASQSIYQILENANYASNYSVNNSALFNAPFVFANLNDSDYTENTTAIPSKNLNQAGSNLKLNRLQYNSLTPLDEYQIRGEEIHTKMTSEKDLELALNGRHTPKILNKIERALSRDIALTNIPDHTYAIPEKSDVDVNFSNVGATSKTRFYSVSRARWAGNIAQQKFSQQLSLDFYARGIRSGFGMQANYDYYGNGVIQNWNTAFIYSPKISLSRSISIEPALRFKMGNQLLDRTKIQNNSPVEFETGHTQQFNYDTSLAIGRKLWYRDVDAGLTINTPLFYLGFQATNLLGHYNNIYSNTDFSNSKAYSTINLIAGTQYISRNEKLVFSPYFYADFNPYRKNYFAGFSLKAFSIMIGASYGSNQQWTGLIGLSRPHFSLFAQSTYAPSTVLGTNALTHQLTIRFNSSESRKARRYITL